MINLLPSVIFTRLHAFLVHKSYLISIIFVIKVYFKNSIFYTALQKIGKETLENVKSMKYLGMTIDSIIKFCKHIKRFEDSVGHSIYRLRKLPNPIQMIRVFNTFVKPIIQYIILVYETASKTNTDNKDAKISRNLRVLIFKKLCWFCCSYRRFS